MPYWSGAAITMIGLDRIDDAAQVGLPGDDGTAPHDQHDVMQWLAGIVADVLARA
ncbi:MAG TPA: hypothetical protein VIG54_07895 [Lysobacter sp.]